MRAVKKLQGRPPSKGGRPCYICYKYGVGVPSLWLGTQEECRPIDGGDSRKNEGADSGADDGVDNGADDGDVTDAGLSRRGRQDGCSTFTARDDDRSRDNHGSSGDKGVGKNDVADAASCQHGRHEGRPILARV